MTDIEIKPLDEEKLYRVATYTDGIAGQLQVREPYNFDGNRVLSREVEYIGTTQIQTTRGPLNVQFSITATSLRQAFELWGEGARIACKATINDIQSKALRQSILAPGKKSV